MKVVVLDGFMVRQGVVDSSQLDQLFDVIWYDETPPELAAARIGKAQAVFVNRTRLTARVFAECPTLLFAGSFGTGYNQIDLSAASRAGVTVCNVPQYSTNAVAQHTIALLLAIACQIPAHNGFVKAGEWGSLSDPPLVNRGMFELAGKTLGLVGYGNIARSVGKIADTLQMHVTAFSRHIDRAPHDPYATFLPLDELLRQSDVISLHCPLTAETCKMVNADFLNRMKPGAVLLNTARGAILEESAVVDALDSGRLWMAGIDVFPEEPVLSHHPLAFHPKVICTPHVAWTPNETRTRLLEISAQNLLCFLNGTPQNVVNYI